MRGSHKRGLIPWDGPAAGWPDGVAQYGEVTAEPMQVGDVLAFHNLVLHSTAPNDRVERVRWSIDLRYMRVDEGFGWHKLGAGFEERFPTFIAASATEGRAESWEQWRRNWGEGPPPSKL